MVRGTVRVSCGVAVLWALQAWLPSAQAGVDVKIPLKVQAFDLKDVRLLDGPCKTAQEANRRYLHSLDADRLLRNFRINAGLEAPGQALGGWEKPDCEVRGHFVGHYLSACALMYAGAGDRALKEKADRMVAELAKCQMALGGEYLSAFPESFWDRLEAMSKPPWAPYYTIHKIMAGLYDMVVLCGNQQALGILNGMASYFKKRFDKLSIWQVDRLLTVEFGGMSEVLHDLYGVTGNPDHLAIAHTFDQAAFLGPLALEHDNLSRIHANTHIPKICGAARRHELTGDPRYRTIVRYAWDRVVHTRSYATGGSNEGEHWPDPKKLAGTLTDRNQECCTTYNMLKVTKYLFRWTADGRYADFYERAFFNGILGTQHPKTGMLMYFVPLATGYTKITGGRGFSKPTDSFWCCTGTGIESFAKLADSIYFHDDDGIYVNLFIASEVKWPEKGVRLQQMTRFPEQHGARFVMQVDRPTTLTLHVHVPYWARAGIEVKVNGKRTDVEAKPSSYASLRRTWKKGDEVDVSLPMSLHAQPMPDDPALVALMYGPVVLAGLTEKKSLYFVADAHDLDAWIKPVEGKPLMFRTAGQPTNTTFIPLYKVLDEAYGVYWPVVNKGSDRHKEILAQEETRRRREARIVDRVLPNDKASEFAHNLQGKNTQAGPFGRKSWRHAHSQGWWSWDLKVWPDVQMTLVCTYWGSDVPQRKFDIRVDGKVIATQELNRNKPGKFFDVEYEIPKAITRGKEKVTIRFVAHAKCTAGGVFECATLKPQE